MFYLLEPPDNSSSSSDISKARFAIEFKPPWELHLPANLKDIFNENKSQSDDKYIKAIQQLYGYMSFNNLEFGVLSNYDSTFIFRRVEEDNKLQISPMFRYSDTGLESPLAALTYLCHYTSTKKWFYWSPLATISPSQSQCLLNFDPEMDVVSHNGVGIDWQRMILHLETRVSKNIASVMTGYVTNNEAPTAMVLKSVIFKLYDLTDSEAVEPANRELVA